MTCWRAGFFTAEFCCKQVDGRHSDQEEHPGTVRWRRQLGSVAWQPAQQMLLSQSVYIYAAAVDWLSDSLVDWLRSVQWSWDVCWEGCGLLLFQRGMHLLRYFTKIYVNGKFTLSSASYVWAKKSKLQTVVHIIAKYWPTFWKFFYRHTLWKICNKAIIGYLTIPLLCHNATLDDAKC